MTAAGGGSPPPSPTRPRRYAGQTEAERVADRRRRLLDSGFALFGTEGLHLVSITRLCRHAGLTEHHFYAAFGTKAALLAAVYEEQVAGITQVAADALAAEASLEPSSMTSTSSGRRVWFSSERTVA